VIDDYQGSENRTGVAQRSTLKAKIERASFFVDDSTQTRS